MGHKGSQGPTPELPALNLPLETGEPGQFFGFPFAKQDTGIMGLYDPLLVYGCPGLSSGRLTDEKSTGLKYGPYWGLWFLYCL